MTVTDTGLPAAMQSLGQAVDALHALSAGGEPPRC